MYKKYIYFIAVYLILSFSNINLAQNLKLDFLIIGAPKCGTTSLYYYLKWHPNILHTRKQVSFFDRNFSKGILWYGMCLGRIKKKKLVSESTPHYLFHPLVPQRVAQLFPDIKIIILLRNPVERAFSNYRMNLRQHRETLDFEQAINHEVQVIKRIEEKILIDKRYEDFGYFSYRSRSYCARGMYIYHIKYWMQFFPKEQFLIIKSEDLFAQPDIILKQVHQFLGIPHYPLNEYPECNSHLIAMPIDKKIKDQLADFFRPYNEELEKFLGRKFNWE